MDIENRLLNLIATSLDQEYLKHCDINLVKNKGITYKSIIINAPGTIYRNYENASVLFAKLKSDGKKPYISFNTKFLSLFSNAEVSYYYIKSDTEYFRIDLNEFYSLAQNHSVFSFIMQVIFNKLFSFNSFGCCHNYKECSDNKKCIHPDLIYSLGCQYGKNLASGKIFYGKNRNVN